MPVHILDCIRRPASGAVSVRIILEVGLKYRFQHNLGGSLNHPITDRRNTERTLTSPMLRDHHPPQQATLTEQRSALTSLFDGFSVTEIAAAAALEVGEIVAALPADEDPVLTVFANCAVRDGDEETMVQLVAHQITKIGTRRSLLTPMLTWLAQNLTGPAHVEFGKSLPGSPVWQAVLEHFKEATMPAEMKDDGTLIWTAAVLPSQLLPIFQEAIAELPPVATRSARAFADLMLTLDTLQPRQR
jgi:hypothetical protein